MRQKREPNTTKENVDLQLVSGREKACLSTAAATAAIACGSQTRSFMLNLEDTHEQNVRITSSDTTWMVNLTLSIVRTVEIAHGRVLRLLATRFGSSTATGYRIGRIKQYGSARLRKLVQSFWTIRANDDTNAIEGVSFPELLQQQSAIQKYSDEVRARAILFFGELVDFCYFLYREAERYTATACRFCSSAFEPANAPGFRNNTSR